MFDLKTIKSMVPTGEELSDINEALATNDLAAIAYWESLLNARYEISCIEALLALEEASPIARPAAPVKNTGFMRFLFGRN